MSNVPPTLVWRIRSIRLGAALTIAMLCGVAQAADRETHREGTRSLTRTTSATRIDLNALFTDDDSYVAT